MESIAAADVQTIPNATAWLTSPAGKSAISPSFPAALIPGASQAGYAAVIVAIRLNFPLHQYYPAKRPVVAVSIMLPSTLMMI